MPEATAPWGLPPARDTRAAGDAGRFPVSARLFAENAVAGRAGRRIAVGVTDPVAPAESLRAVRERWSVAIDRRPPAGWSAAEGTAWCDLDGSSVLAAATAAARAEIALRHLSARTNLLLGAKAVLVLGQGPLGTALAEALSRIGARVTVASADAPALFAAHLAGRGTVRASAALPPADLLFATGEGHDALTPGALAPGSAPVLVDASAGGTGAGGVDRAAFEAAAVDTGAPRPGVTRFGLPSGEAVLLDPPPPVGDEPADAELALVALLVRHAADAAPGRNPVPPAVDVRLAEALLP